MGIYLRSLSSCERDRARNWRETNFRRAANLALPLAAAVRPGADRWARRGRSRTREVLWDVWFRRGRHGSLSHLHYRRRPLLSLPQHVRAARRWAVACTVRVRAEGDTERCASELRRARAQIPWATFGLLPAHCDRLQRHLGPHLARRRPCSLRWSAGCHDARRRALPSRQPRLPGHRCETPCRRRFTCGVP